VVLYYKRSDIVLASVFCAVLEGVKGNIVKVEVDISKGMPSFNMVGLPDVMIKESKDRIRAAVINAGKEFNYRKIVINLSPASTRKAGTHLDLSIAVAYLCASKQVNPTIVEKYGYIGELSLSGELVRINGIMPLVKAFRESGIEKIILPKKNECEARVFEDVEIYAFDHLEEIIAFLIEETDVNKFCVTKEVKREAYTFDMSDVVGQDYAKRALEIAVAGFHNVVLIGSPGCGKTMLAKRMVTIMPNMSWEEAVETTSIHSVAGILPEDIPFIIERPFREPHHSTSKTALIGGGRYPMPGEISLGNNGVLFLDELPEFRREVLESLRQPMAEGKININRVCGNYEYPAKFLLVGAMNPCKCGYFGSALKECRCKDYEVRKYINKISGPFLDRLDMFIEVSHVSYSTLNSKKSGESSLRIKKRVEKCQEIQRKRYESESIEFNGQLSEGQVRKFCKLTEGAEKLLEMAFEKMKLSIRSYDRIIKLGRTIADLSESLLIEEKHLLEALQFRNVVEKYWK